MKELENELLNQNTDIGDHSLKDMPTQNPESLILAVVKIIEVSRNCISILKPEYTFKSIDHISYGSIKVVVLSEEQLLFPIDTKKNTSTLKNIQRKSQH